MIAARLRITAPPNVPILSAYTRKLVGGIFHLENDACYKFEDIPEPVTTYRVAGRLSALTRFESMRDCQLTPFVGRQKELVQLLSLWARARVGNGQVALICGEPGIGKSRLFRALLESVANEQCAIMCCQCSPHHINSPYHAIIRHLEDTVGFNPQDASGRKLEKLRTMLSVAGPVSSLDLSLYAALLSIPAGNLPLSPELTPKRLRDLTNSALVRYVLSVGGEQPLIIKLADAHWADFEYSGAIWSHNRIDRDGTRLYCRNLQARILHPMGRALGRVHAPA